MNNYLICYLHILTCTIKQHSSVVGDPFGFVFKVSFSYIMCILLLIT